LAICTHLIKDKNATKICTLKFDGYNIANDVWLLNDV